MTYRVYWKLVGRHGAMLDKGGIDEFYANYGECTAAINELLRSYPEVCHSTAEGYWLARRSADADLAIWMWIERTEQRASAPQADRELTA